MAANPSYFNPRSLAGATIAPLLLLFLPKISIHAPSRERHAGARAGKRSGKDFNPRSLAGATSPAKFAAYMGIISIHAPSRERHAGARAGKRSGKDFNPRSLAGATSIVSHSLIFCLFQSTLPRGSDKQMPVPRRLPRDFNPRSLAGATRVRQLHHGPALISIHAPSRERHGHSWRCRMFHRISIHAPSRERHRCVCCASAHGYFNPRSLAGATRIPHKKRETGTISIHAPSRERPKGLYTIEMATSISIHAPSRERRS